MNQLNDKEAIEKEAKRRYKRKKRRFEELIKTYLKEFAERQGGNRYQRKINENK